MIQTLMMDHLTSCIFTLRNIPSSLYKALGGFATNRVNILKLESYMLGNSFNSAQFYIDRKVTHQTLQLKWR